MDRKREILCIFVYVGVEGYTLCIADFPVVIFRRDDH